MNSDPAHDPVRAVELRVLADLVELMDAEELHSPADAPGVRFMAGTTRDLLQRLATRMTTEQRTIAQVTATVRAEGGGG